MNLVKRKIQNLQEGIENKNDVKMKKITDNFFKRSKSASDPLKCPDLLEAEDSQASNLEDLSSDICNQKL